MTPKARDAEDIVAELTRLAEIAEGMLDGEVVKTIVTEKAMHYVANPDPRHRFLAGDYYDVDHESFLAVKKFLMRLERLGKVALNGSVWVPVPGRDQVTVAVQNGAYHRYYEFGQGTLDTPAEMKDVFQTGRIVAVGPAPDDKRVTVLAPVRDSLGDVVAAVELTAPLDAPPPRRLGRFEAYPHPSGRQIA